MDVDFVTLLRAIRKDRRKTVALIVVGLALISFVSGLFGQFVVLMLSVAAVAIAFFVGEFELKRVGIELVTFTVVLAGFVYGPVVGAVLGFVLLTLHLILARSLGPYVIYCVPAMAVVGMLAGYAATDGWLGGDIALIGILLSLLYNFATAGLGSVMLKDLIEETVWSGSNFVLNVVLFAKFAPIVLSAMV